MMKHGRIAVGHPVDVASGEQFTAWHDEETAGNIPLVWRRFYSTRLLEGPSSTLGRGWVHYFDMFLTRDVESFRFFGHDGSEIEFDDPAGAVDKGGRSLNLGGYMELRREGERYAVYHWHDWEEDVRKFMFEAREDGPMLLVAVALPSGHSLDLSYDAHGRLAEVRQSAERRSFLLEYDEPGRLARLLLASPLTAAETSARYEYDERDRLVAVYDAAGVPMRYAYDEQDRLIQETSRTGGSFFMKYDPQGRCVETSGDGGRELKRLQYDQAGRMTRVTDSLGNSTTYLLNESGQVEKEMRTNGAIWTNEYDTFGRLVAKTGPHGETTRYTYDGHGNIETITEPGEAITKFEYDEYHQPTSVTQADGSRWQLEYERGTLTAITDPCGAKTVYVLDAENEIREFLTPTGNRITIEHDPAWLEERYADEYGLIVAYRYDQRLNVVAIYHAHGLDKRLEYDVAGEPIAMIESDGAMRKVTRDEDGQVTRYTDANGHTIKYDYSPYGDVVRVTDANGHAYQFSWDTEGRLVSITNPKGEKAAYAYDAVGNLIERVSFDGRKEGAEFDLSNRLVRLTRADGTTLESRYDVASNLLEITSAGQRLVAHHYDPLGQLTETITPDATVKFEYDLCGRVTAETQNGLRVEYGFHPDGDLASRRFLNTRVGPLLFDYDRRGRLTALRSAERIYQRFAYDSADLLLASDGGAFIERFAYDARQRLKSQEVVRKADGQKIVAREYDYDAEDNLIGVADSLRGRSSYEYDAAERLVKSTHANRTTIYEYDPCGNLTRKGSSQLRYARGNRLQQNGAFKYARDANGQLAATAVAEQRTDFVWNALGQLTAARHPDGSQTSFGYDGLGRRVSKTHNRQITYFFWAGNDLLAEQTGEDMIEYAIGEFEPHIIWENGELHHVVTAHMEMPYELLDAQGELVWWGEYDDWGLLLRETGSRTAQRLRFPGQYHDAETALHYNRFRYYRPFDGQFISPDPNELAGGFNEFLYAPNPINWIDPLGLQCGNTSCKKNQVYVLTRKKKIIYVGITNQKARQRMLQHRQLKTFDKMRVIAKNLKRRQARNIEGSALNRIHRGQIAGVGKLLNARRKDKAYYHSYSNNPSGGGRKLLSINDVINALNQNLGEEK